MNLLPIFFLVSKVRIGSLSSSPFHFSSLHNPRGGKLGRERRSLTLFVSGNLSLIIIIVIIIIIHYFLFFVAGSDRADVEQLSRGI